MFPISKCRGNWDVSRCIIWVLVKRKPVCNAKFRFFWRAKHVFFRKSPRKNDSAALLEHWPQACRVKITFTELPRNRFVSWQKFRWNVLWTGFHWESAFVRQIPNPILISVLTSVWVSYSLESTHKYHCMTGCNFWEKEIVKLTRIIFLFLFWTSLWVIIC